MKNLIKLIMIFGITNCYAVTVTYGSFPENNTNFYFSDERGNSISVGTTQAIPYIYNQYPSAVWVDAATNRLPANMVIYQYINGYPAYLCRVLLNDEWVYGQLMVNQGCMLNMNEDEMYSSFQVLIK